MSEAKFTKGEWLCWGDKVGIVDKSDTQSYGMMLDIAHIEKFDFPDEYVANAHLIAAAPEMYEMLERCKKEMSKSGYDASPIENLLAKARGEHES